MNPRPRSSPTHPRDVSSTRPRPLVRGRVGRVAETTDQAGTSQTYVANPCASCNRTAIVMVSMVPGRDGKPWALCRACWADGAPEAPEVEDVQAEQLEVAL